MKLSEVSERDLKMIGQLINSLQVARFDVTGKDACALGDSIRWLQTFAVEASHSFKEKVAPETSAVDEPLKITSVGKNKK
jgi:hypothetical protein